MSFDDAFLEIREIFSEALHLVIFLDGSISSHHALPGDDPSRPTPPSTPSVVKSLKGLTLVAIYGAIERSVNSIVEQAIDTISTQSERISGCGPEVQALFFYPTIKSVRDCSLDRIIEKSYPLFISLQKQDLTIIRENPFLQLLQNVDGATLELLAHRLGIKGYKVEPSAKARLNNLRERRNAVAHGRESSAVVGERFSNQDIRKLYEVADEETHRFADTVRDHFQGRNYVVRTA